MLSPKVSRGREMKDDPEEQRVFAESQRRANLAARRAYREKLRTPLHQTLRWAAEPVKAANTFVRRKRFDAKRARIMAAYLAQPGFKGLQVGCGPNRMEGWINCDMLPFRLPKRKLNNHEAAQDFPLDITRPLPLADGIFDAVYGEEIIEHIEKDYAEAFMVEAHRILKPGGILRFATPDLDGMCRAFLRLDEGIEPDSFEPTWYVGPWSAENWINHMFRDFGHEYIWNYAEMERALRAAGFSEIWRVKQGETRSGLSELDGAERRRPKPGTAFARFSESARLVVEARR